MKKKHLLSPYDENSQQIKHKKYTSTKKNLKHIVSIIVNDEKLAVFPQFGLRQR